MILGLEEKLIEVDAVDEGDIEDVTVAEGETDRVADAEGEAESDGVVLADAAADAVTLTEAARETDTDGDTVALALPEEDTELLGDTLGVGEGVGEMTVKVIVAVTDVAGKRASETVTCSVLVPIRLGVPLKTPADDMVMPAGRLPDDTTTARGGRAPAAVIAAGPYGLPRGASGNDVVVTVTFSMGMREPMLRDANVW